MDEPEDKFSDIDPIEILRSADPEAVAACSDTEFHRVGEEGEFLFPVLHSTFTVTYPECKVSAPTELDSFPIKLLALIYLVRADGTPLETIWIPYRALPGGLFYEQVLRREVLIPLASEFKTDLEGFCRASQLLGAIEEGSADAGFTFAPFPLIRINVSLWTEDEEFPAEVKLLFDANSPHYMNAFEMKMLAKEISSRLMKIRRGEMIISLDR